jgi:hypothetical protein
MKMFSDDPIERAEWAIAAEKWIVERVATSHEGLTKDSVARLFAEAHADGWKCGRAYAPKSHVINFAVAPDLDTSFGEMRELLPSLSGERQ